MSYSAFKLTEETINKLKAIFPPIYEKFIGHHITYKFPHKSSDTIPDISSFKVIGYVKDDSLEALIVELNGNKYRSDGKIFHITWSLSGNRKPVDSNFLIDNSKVVGIRQYVEIEPIDIFAVYGVFN